MINVLPWRWYELPNTNVIIPPQAEEKRVPLRTWANACPPKERQVQVEDFGPSWPSSLGGAFLKPEQDRVMVAWNMRILCCVEWILLSTLLSTFKCLLL